MRDLVRNMQPIYFSCLSDVGTTDEWGNPQKGNTDPIKYKISISASKGEAEEQIFGKDIKYSRVMITHDKNCKIDEYSKIWLGIEPTVIVNGKVNPVKHNYEVVAVSSSLNSQAYAIKRVDIS
ncbi:MAG: hypothetical protein RSF40_02155 [Oscillospiraceae bacterium]